jgi:hypothetical protein
MFDRILASRIVVAIGSAALIIALAAGVSPAQASTASTPSTSHHHVRVHATKSVQGGAVAGPDFTCPSRSFCLFQEPNLVGNVFVFTTDVYNGQWFSVTASPFDFSLPWGSLNDNSNSTVYFWDAQTGNEYCITPGQRGNPTGSSAGVIHARYIFIKLGVPTCLYPTPPS